MPKPSKKKNTIGIGRKYTGDLNIPIDVEDATEEHCSSEFSRKLDLLFVELGVNSGDWETLAFTLALWHVPGFQVHAFDKEAKVGRPGKWSDSNNIALARIVEGVIAEAQRNPILVGRKTVAGACEHISKSGQYPSFANPNGNDHKAWAKTLAKHVSAGRKLLKLVDAANSSTTGKKAIEKHFAKPIEGPISGNE